MNDELIIASRILLVDEIANYLKINKRVDIEVIYNHFMPKSYTHFVAYTNELNDVRKMLFEKNILQNSIYILENFYEEKEKRDLMSELLQFFLSSKPYRDAPLFFESYLKKLKLEINELKIKDKSYELEDLIHAALASIFLSIGNDTYLDEKELEALQSHLIDFYNLLDLVDLYDFSIKSYLDSHHLSKKELSEIKEPIYSLIKSDGVVSIHERSTAIRIFQKLSAQSTLKDSKDSVLPLIHMIISFSDGSFHKKEKEDFLMKYGKDYFKSEKKAILLIDLLMSFTNIYKKDFYFFKELLPHNQKTVDKICLMYLVNEKYFSQREDKTLNYKMQMLSSICSNHFLDKATKILSGIVIPEELLVFSCHFFKRDRIKNNKVLKLDVNYFKRVFESLKVNGDALTYDLLVKIITSDEKITTAEYKCLHEQFEKLNLDYVSLKKAFYKERLIDGEKDYSYDEYERLERVA